MPHRVSDALRKVTNAAKHSEPQKFKDCQTSAEVFDLYTRQMNPPERASFDLRMTELMARTAEFDRERPARATVNPASESSVTLPAKLNPSTNSESHELTRFDIIQQVARQGHLQTTEV